MSLLVAQLVKNLLAMRDTWVRPLGWEDSLEEGMATHFSILAWRIPMDRGAWRATVQEIAKESDTAEQLSKRSTAQELSLLFVAQSCLTLLQASGL